MNNLVNTINDEWIKRYSGEKVFEESALINRVKNLAEDRDNWLFNAKVNQKEFLKLEEKLRNLDVNIIYEI